MKVLHRYLIPEKGLEELVWVNKELNHRTSKPKTILRAFGDEVKVGDLSNTGIVAHELGRSLWLRFFEL